MPHKDHRDRLRVVNGSLKKTPGGLTAKDLKRNKSGRLVSKRKSKPLGRKLRKSEFYCVGCRKAVQGENIRAVKTRVTGQPMLKGECAKCGAKVCKFVPRK